MAGTSRNTLVLALIVTALGLAALGEQARELLQRPRPLSPVDVRAVNQIVLECTDCPRLTLQKITGRWQLSEPYALPASPARVQSLLGIAAAPAKHWRASATSERPEAGLSPPLATVRIGNARFDIGALDPIRRLRYVRHAGQVALIPDDYGDFAQLTAERLVDPRPLAQDSFDEALLDGRPLAGPARTRLLELQAQRVQPAPPGARGRVLALRRASGSEQIFQLCRYGDVWQLVRSDPPVSYVLAGEDAQALIAGAPEPPRP